MPKGITVNQDIYERLCRAYWTKYSGSENKKADLLIQDIKKIHGEVSIGNRTIQNFFNQDKLPNCTPQKLDYLVSALLGFNSYQKVLDELSPQVFQSLDSIEYKKYWDYISARTRYAKVPNSSVPIDISDKYVEIELLETLYSRRVKKDPAIAFQEIKGFLQDNKAEDKIPRKPLKDIFQRNEENLKVMLFGGPGAGKTTLLKYLSLQLFGEMGNSSLFGQTILPIFISLREFSIYTTNVENAKSASVIPTKTLLLEYIKLEIGEYFDDFEVSFLSLLRSGNCLVMLDALDEVNSKNLSLVSDSISGFVRRFKDCKYIITSRVGSSEYNFNELGFSDHEIAEFSSDQVEKFAKKYLSSSSDAEVLKFFLDQYRDAREFQKGKISFLDGIVERPLLLTMICEIFRSGGGTIPNNKYELYEKNVDALFYKWDHSRRISRGRDILSKNRKIDLLGKIAFEGFHQDDQIAEWTKRELIDEIAKFLDNFELHAPHYEDTEETLKDFEAIESEKKQRAAEELLKSFEEDEGILVQVYEDIYQFRHITFQSYFAAEYIADFSWDSGDQTHKQLIDKYLTTPNWDNVFIFLAGRLRKGNVLLKRLFSRSSKYQEESKKVKSFIEWLSEITLTSGYQQDHSSWRAFYLRMDLHTDLFIDRDSPGKEMDDCREFAIKVSEILRYLSFFRKNIVEKTKKSSVELSLAAIHSKAVDLSSGKSTEKDLDLFNEKIRRQEIFVQEQVIGEEKSISSIQDIGAFLREDILKDIEQSEHIEEKKKNRLKKGIMHLSDQAKHLKANDKEGIKAWTSDLQCLMSEELNIGKNIKFGRDDLNCLKNYLHANLIMLECLSSNLSSNREMREKILTSLFLPYSLLKEKFSEDDELKDIFEE